MHTMADNLFNMNQIRNTKINAEKYLFEAENKKIAAEQAYFSVLKNKQQAEQDYELAVIKEKQAEHDYQTALMKHPQQKIESIFLHLHCREEGCSNVFVKCNWSDTEQFLQNLPLLYQFVEITTLNGGDPEFPLTDVNFAVYCDIILNQTCAIVLLQKIILLISNLIGAHTMEL